jgi:cobalt/nickel transport system permease protein
MWAATAGTIIYCSGRLTQEMDDRRVPLMGVLAAFVFAAQMINFTIPGTGSSGHLGGGLLLAILLGPHAALLTMASVLTVQALFFADGGLLALGTNIFNLGILPCFIAYPLVFKRIVAARPGRGRLLTASLAAAVVGLQFGALGVVMETTLSGITALPFISFAILMQPIHLAIGFVEGLATAGVVTFVRQAQPELLADPVGDRPVGRAARQGVLIILLLGAIVAGGWLSWFASEKPDGLEWSVARIIGSAEVAAPPDTIHTTLERLQGKSTLMPDYGFKLSASDTSASSDGTATSMAGLLGGLMTLAASLAIGLFLKRRATRS